MKSHSAEVETGERAGEKGLPISHSSSSHLWSEPQPVGPGSLAQAGPWGRARQLTSAEAGLALER